MEKALFIIMAVGVLLPFIGIFLNSQKQNVSIKVKDGDRTLISATGKTADEALLKIFDRLNGRIKASSKPDVIRACIDQMESAFTQAESDISGKTRKACNDILDGARKIYSEAAAESEKKLEAQTEHRRMVARERRLMTDSLRYDILRRDGFRCVLCGASAAEGAKLHVDHIFPVSKGGKTVPSNLRTLCERCNLGKGSKIESEPPVSAQECRNWSKEEAMVFLSREGVRYVDYTERGGCFWIEMSDENLKLLEGVTIEGKNLQKAGHS